MKGLQDYEAWPVAYVLNTAVLQSEQVYCSVIVAWLIVNKYKFAKS